MAVALQTSDGVSPPEDADHRRLKPLTTGAAGGEFQAGRHAVRESPPINANVLSRSVCEASTVSRVSRGPHRSRSRTSCPKDLVGIQIGRSASRLLRVWANPGGEFAYRRITRIKPATPPRSSRRVYGAAIEVRGSRRYLAVLAGLFACVVRLFVAAVGFAPAYRGADSSRSVCA